MHSHLLILTTALSASLLVFGCGDDGGSTDSGTDVGADTGDDAELDAEDDGGEDSGDDAETDATTDAGEDAGSDSGDADADTECRVPAYLEIEGDGSRSFQRIGASGRQHIVPQNRIGVINTVRIASCDDNCEVCEFEGPVTREGAERLANRRRCMNSFNTECSTDADCADLGGVPGTEVCHFAQAMLSSAPNTCAIAALVPREGEEWPITGTFNLRTGRMVYERYEIRNFTAAEGRCPVCVGDTTLNDGVRDGTCQVATGEGVPPATNPREGEACDGNSVWSTLGGGVISFDCPGGVAAPAAGSSLRSTSDGARWTLDEASVDCGDGSGDKCFCGVCEDMPLIPCRLDSECPTGTCSGSAADSPSIANSCADDSPCVVDPDTNRGSCMSPMGMALACFGDSPGDEIVAGGGAEAIGDDFRVFLGSISCIPSVPTPGVNGFLGFPGPLVLESSQIVRIIYDE